MKRGVLTLAAMAALFALPALAEPQEAPAEAPAAAAAVVLPPDVFVTAQGNEQFLARDLILFAKVQNANGEIIGDVEDLILNADNQIVGVILGTGGFAGFGEKRIGVNLSALQFKNVDGNVTVVLPQATKEVIDAVPEFVRKQPPKSLMDRAIERAKELTAKSTVTAKDAYEKAKKEAGPALEKAKESAEEAYEKAKEATKPALERAGEVAKGAYDGARNAMKSEPDGTVTTPPAETTPPPADTPVESSPSEPTPETPAQP